MKKIFSNKIYWMLLAAIVPLWLMNFLSGQNSFFGQDRAAEILPNQAPIQIQVQNADVPTVMVEQDQMTLKLSITLSTLHASAATQPENRTEKYVSDIPRASAAALNLSLFLNQAYAADIGAVQAEAVAAKKVSARQATERHQELMLNIDKLTRPKIESPNEDPFVAKLPPPPPPPKPIPPPPPPAPVAPELPFAFMGRMVENDRTTLFLTRQNESYTVKVNDVLVHEYRVDKIDNDQVIFTYLPLNIQQTMYIGRSG